MAKNYLLYATVFVLIPALAISSPATVQAAAPASAAAAAGAEAAPPGAVTLKGQIVCSGCWDEADRAKTPYGNSDDLKCAKACSLKGIPPGLAVAKGKGDQFDLYILSTGALQLGEKGWLPYMGKYASVSGSIEDKAGKKTLKVSKLVDITSQEAGFSR